jgi:CDP-diacylglycerol--serine O-phosphatidyltransferase
MNGMKRLRLQERWIDPRSPDRHPRRAAYALPTFFTAGNLFLGFYAMMESFRGAMLIATAVDTANWHFRAAAIAIGAAVFLDGLDGRIARMTKTVSDFGREMDSLADVISFGIAPAVLAYTWGVEFAGAPPAPLTLEHLHRAGYFFALYLLCGAFGGAIQRASKSRAQESGTIGPQVLCRMPIPAAAAMVAAVVYALVDYGPAVVGVLRRVAADAGLLSF